MVKVDYFNEAESIKKSVDLLMANVVNNCNKYLKKVLKENNNSIPFHTYDDGLQMDDNSFCVPYNGGNHPEYASNLFSDVESIFMNDGAIYLETEDCEEYGLENIDIYTLYDLCEFIHDVILA